MYQYLLFDLDGTLTDSEEGITKCVQSALRHFGIEVADRKELHPFIGPPLTASFMKYYHLTEEEAEEAVGYYRERYEKTGIFENSVYPGIPEALSALKKAGKTLLTASSKPEVYVRQILKRFELSPYFDAVIGAGMDERKADKAYVIEDALQRYGVPEERRQEVLMIGDRNSDVEGAKQCGLDCLGVYFGFAAPGELEEAGATYIVDTVEEMKDFLLKH